MANKRISDLPVVTSTTTGDVVAIDGATTRKVTVEDLLGDNVHAIKGLTSAADKGIQFTGAGTAAVYDLTAAGKAILDDADAAAQRTTLGLVIGTDVQAHSVDLDAVTGTNTGDQTITLTGDVTGTGTGSFAATIGATKVTSAMLNADVFSTAHSWSGQQTFVAPALGTPASGVATNLTGTAAGLTAGNVTTNANLTGDVTSVGNATTIGANKVTSSMLNSDVFSSTHTWGGVQTFSAAPIVPTQSPSDNSTKAASTAYVDAQVAGGVAGVASIAGNTGAFTLSTGITNSGNDIRLSVGQLPGTTTNDSATSGNVGELIESTVLTASKVSLTTGTVANITSISLTAGNWLVWGNVVFITSGGGTTSTDHICWISATSATLPTQPNAGAYNRFSGATLTNTNLSLPTGAVNLKLSGTTTVYLEVYSSFATSTMAAYGYIGAVRIR